jgi:hypothetical protein
VIVVFDGTFPVHYGQAYVLSRPEDVNSDLEDAFIGQQNGLLGAAVPGQLWITTGLHTGTVRLRIVSSDRNPGVDGEWQEVVEASFAPGTPGAALTGWGGQAKPIALSLDTTPYRVRLCASYMDEARQQDTILDGESPIDAYLLTFWEADPAPDRVVKQTSDIAAYWHRWAQALR